MRKASEDAPVPGPTLVDRLHARLAVRARPGTGIRAQPEPRSMGDPARGRQILAGNWLLAGYLVEAPGGASPFGITQLEPGFEEALHGFAWLDDLVAVGTLSAYRTARVCVFDWLDRFGRGRGPGWTPALTGRRLMRWINHALVLLAAQGPEGQRRLYRSLGAQTLFLARRGRSARAGLDRLEAMTGLLTAGLVLDGMSASAEDAAALLAEECGRVVDGEGGVPSRNPEELVEVLTLLTWAAEALDDHGKPVPEGLRAALARIVPTLRALRHADGGLPRFHGGGRGAEGQVDRAIAVARATARATGGAARMVAPARPMGYEKLRAGRTSVVFDVAAPPSDDAPGTSHASTLAIEVTSGRHPLIVNCGSGADFGADWRRAGRATAFHSVLGIDGRSSAALNPPARFAGRRIEPMTGGPVDVGAERSDGPNGTVVEAYHDAWRRTYGLVYARRIEMDRQGVKLTGEETLAAVTPDDRAAFDRALDAGALQGVPYALRFHMHPEVTASLDLNGAAISLTLPSGEIWILRHDGVAGLAIEPGIYLQSGRLRPRQAQQAVLSGRLFDPVSRVRWSLRKVREGDPVAAET